MESPTVLLRPRFALAPFPWWVRLALLGVALIPLLLYGRYRSLSRLHLAWVAAHRHHDVAAMEQLYCWEGVDAAERQRMRLLFAQEMENPLRSVDVFQSLRTPAQPGWRPNLPPVAELAVTYDTPERLTVRFLIGRDGLVSHRLVMMVPEK
jgi:hypothetical protein